MTLGERLKSARKALNMTQETFCAPLGVNKAAISKIEKGENGLTPSLAKLISREYHISEDWLRSGEGEMFVTMSAAEKRAAWAGEALGLPADHPRVRAWCLLMEMPDETLAMVMAAIDRLHELEQREAEETAQSEDK